MIGQIVLSRVFNQCGIGWCCFEFGTYALGWLGTSNGLFCCIECHCLGGHCMWPWHCIGLDHLFNNSQSRVCSLLVMLGWVGHHWLGFFFVSVGLGSVALSFALLPCDGWAR